MDSTSLAIAALSVAVGLSTAVIFVFALRSIRVIRNRPSTVARLVFFVAIGASALYLPERVEPLIGPELRSVLPIPNLIADISQDPFVARVLTDHPELVEPLETQLKASYLKDGRAGVLLEQMRFGQKIAVDPQFDYFARARSIDLIALMNLQLQIFEAMQAAEPDLCHPYLFGISAGDLATAERINKAVPAQMNDLVNDLILHAYDDIPYYDRAAGQRVIERAQVSTALKFGNDGMALMGNERKPKSMAEHETLCAVYVSLLDGILQDGQINASLGLRAMFDKGEIDLKGERA